MAGTLPPRTTYKPWLPPYRQHFELPVPDNRCDDGTNKELSAYELSSRNPNQMYYWTEEWQSSEQAARADILAGRVTVLAGPSGVEAHFAALTEKSRGEKRQRRGSARQQQGPRGQDYPDIR